MSELEDEQAVSDEDEPQYLADLGPPAPSDSAAAHRRCILHVDIDCFYAQVEMLERPELREKPLGVQQKNIVVTCNYVARARGVTKCCYIDEARRACPELVLVDGSDLTRYRRASAQVHRLLQRFSRQVERLGFDENFLDVTVSADEQVAAADRDLAPEGHVLGAPTDCGCGCGPRLSAGSQLAAAVRQSLRQQLGISCCAGVGHNKLLAKLACASHKPDQQTVVFSGAADALLLGVGSARGLPGIGSRTAAQLSEQGIGTVRELRQCAPARLHAILGRTARRVSQLAWGQDPTPVRTSSAALSIGVEDGFRRVDCLDECELKLRELARRVVNLLREDGRIPTVLKVSARRYNRDYFRFRETRQSKVQRSVFSKLPAGDDGGLIDSIVAEAMVLLKKMLKDEPFHLTLLGLAVTGFEEQGSEGSGDITKFLKKVDGDVTVQKKRRLSGDVNLNQDTPIPSGVDPHIWRDLPSDVKQELLQDEPEYHKKPKQRSIADFFGGPSSSARKPSGGVEDAQKTHFSRSETPPHPVSPVIAESSDSSVELIKDPPDPHGSDSVDPDDPDSCSPAVLQEVQASDGSLAGDVSPGPAPEQSGSDRGGRADSRGVNPGGPAEVREGGGPAEVRDGGGRAEVWDEEVFSQLPPDIQYELRQERRRSRNTTSRPGRSPRRPGRSGSILDFFNK